MPISLVVTIPDNLMDRDKRIGAIVAAVLDARGTIYLHNVDDDEDVPPNLVQLRREDEN